MPPYQAPRVDVDEDEDNNEDYENVDRLTREYGKRPRRPILIDDDEVEIISDDEENDGGLEHIDLTGDDEDHQGGEGHDFSRNPGLQPHQTRLESYHRDGLRISPCTLVELYQKLQPFNMEFLEVKVIYSQPGNGGRQVFVRGIPYARNRSLRAMLERYGNEICQILEVDDNDPRQPQDQALVEIEFAAIKRVRKFTITNTHTRKTHAIWQISTRTK
ncbi:hypothetical protein MCOR25_010424 [Pyricularia grisea]|nr:hypothetical protein MCOR25_010424 [Pyricularia grisea]